MLLIPSSVFFISVLVLFISVLQFLCCRCIASVVSDSVRSYGRQPTRLCRPWDSPGKNTGVGCHFLLQRMKVKSESEVAQSCLTRSDGMDCSLPGSHPWDFAGKSTGVGLPLPSPVSSSRSLLNISYIFLIHASSKILDHLYYHYEFIFR